jgi:hypothetical protein
VCFHFLRFGSRDLRAGPTSFAKIARPMTDDQDDALSADTEYRRLAAPTPAFRVPSHIYRHTRLRLEFRVLKYTRYPFDTLKVIPADSDLAFASDSGQTRILYNRPGDRHTLWVQYVSKLNGSPSLKAQR